MSKSSYHKLGRGSYHRMGQHLNAKPRAYTPQLIWDLVDTWFNCSMDRFRNNLSTVAKDDQRAGRTILTTDKIVNCINASLHIDSGRWVYSCNDLSPALIKYAVRHYESVQRGLLDGS